ncbi:MAG: Rne/Rng family ribonuclease [Pseudomonadota bacterium]
MSNKMLIDAAHPEETRVVVVKGNRVEEFDFEAQARKQLRGSIYLAKVTRVEPSLQAAFVDYGGNRHGFLAFSEIHPDYYQIPAADRQALLEEEEEDEIAAAAEEASEDDQPAGKKRGRRGRSKKAAPATETESTETETDDGDSEEPKDGEAVALDASPDEVISEDVEAAAEDDNADQTDPSDEVDATDNEDDSSADQNADAELNGSEDAPTEEELAASGDDPEETVDSVGDEDAMEEVPQRKPRRKRNYKIQEVIKRKQVLLVQVVKEERGNKGAALTTYLSLAGRYCVLMPNTARGGGISRKITNAGDRKRLKDIARELEVPKGMGVILRTAGASRTKAEVRRDFEYLLRLWEAVRTLTLESMAPSLVYEEGNIVKRAIRDIYSKEIAEVLVAGDGAYKEAREFMRMLMPSHAKNIHLYKDDDPIFSHFDVEQQLDAMFGSQVTLKSGGYIVINQTEALVAIDVNSGRATKEHSIEDTALKTNLEAAEEISRQLRLRDLAGLVVIDFIDMEENRNNRAVERKLKECLKTDRARIQVGRISHFGLLEMSRQRIRSGIMEGSFITCPHCAGSGMIRSSESVALQVLRSIEDAQRKRAVNVTVRARPDAALYILNNKRGHLWELEQRYGISVTIVAEDRPGDGPFAIEIGAAASQPAKARKGTSHITVNDAVDEEAEESSARSNDDDSEAGTEDGRQRRRRRGRRGGRRRRGSNGASSDNGAETNDIAPEDAASDIDASEGASQDAQSEDTVEEKAASDEKPKRGRKTGRRRVSRKTEAESPETAPDETQSAEAVATDQDNAAVPEDADAPSESAENAGATDEPAAPEPEAAAMSPTPEPQQEDAELAEAEAAVVAEAPQEPAKPRRKGWWQRALGADDS